MAGLLVLGGDGTVDKIDKQGEPLRDVRNLKDYNKHKLTEDAQNIQKEAIKDLYDAGETEKTKKGTVGSSAGIKPRHLSPEIQRVRENAAAGLDPHRVLDNYQADVLLENGVNIIIFDAKEVK